MKIENQKLLLRYYQRLDHLNKLEVQELAKQGFLPSAIATCHRLPICAACQIGKGTKKKTMKDAKIMKDHITEPGDLIHMDQAESSTRERTLLTVAKTTSTKCMLYPSL